MNDGALLDLATEIRAEHEACSVAAETAARHAIKAGHLLIQAKDGMPHGEWLRWLAKHCEVSARTAQAYMRLARKAAELGEAEAQRVADLPVRQAIKAIADSRSEVEPPPAHNPYRCAPPSDKHVWEWAERQVSAPFNRFDLENPGCARNKLYQQAGVPAPVAVFLRLHEKGVPALRLVSVSDLMDAFRALAPVGEEGASLGELGLDFDFADLTSQAAANLLRLLPLLATRAIGQIIGELDYREKTYLTGGAEGYYRAYGRDRETAHDTVMAHLDAELAELREASPA
ncbi:MAG: DUF3102 domain-containing protein [Gammaproteobacteria bacterium]|nr:DUF3102 domain-containing protein [Gammaproteobacteria bacterium]